MKINGLRIGLENKGSQDDFAPVFPLYALAYSRFGLALLSCGRLSNKPETAKKSDLRMLKADL